MRRITSGDSGARSPARAGERQTGHSALRANHGRMQPSQKVCSHERMNIMAEGPSDGKERHTAQRSASVRTPLGAALSSAAAAAAAAAPAASSLGAPTLSPTPAIGVSVIAARTCRGLPRQALCECRCAHGDGEGGRSDPRTAFLHLLSRPSHVRYAHDREPTRPPPTTVRGFIPTDAVQRRGRRRGGAPDGAAAMTRRITACRRRGYDPRPPRTHSVVYVRPRAAHTNFVAYTTTSAPTRG
mmetsp:Transcript_16034/g.55999  ORF Transcript_16034/g.55999 Transcript_16034/m.55999 type:complete len:242 (+) Transcript_16034:535-1260(+)